MLAFRILGPLEVRRDVTDLALGGRKQRALLAALLLHPNEPVSAERLAVALWGEDAPPGAVKTVQVHMSRLRRALGDGGIITTTRAGYRLRVQPDELDAERFERLIEDGRQALSAGHPEQAAGLLREALSLWRGPPLADLTFEAFAQREIARLEEQHLSAIEARVEADLARAEHAALVPELRRLVGEHPTSEQLAGDLMLALYRCGRQAEALDVYQNARHRLADELGIEPGTELQALHEAILGHDPALALQPATDELPRELDPAAAPPLAGRSGELAWLRARWNEARAGAGGLVTLAGPPGIGKTRLVAELAEEAHRHGATVLYASGAGAGGALAVASDASRPLLFVMDEADRAAEEVVARLLELAQGAALVLALGEDLDALALEPDRALTLKRLDSEGVRAIAALYAPDHGADDIPADWLLGASGGVPRRVHDVARQWARREASQRVVAVAGRAAAGRAALRSMEDELAGGVVQLQTAFEPAESTADADEQVVCPFKGLASFEVTDAPYFFGRERLVAELVARLVGAPLLGVVGPSGSGKSSVVRAGLLPALEGGVLPGSQAWPQVLIRPGEHPMQVLREAKTELAPGERAVLAVDQFEETFTLCRDERERTAFVSALVRASQGRDESIVVVAIRADFYGRCAAYPELSRLLAANHVLVGAMGRAELRRAVVCPAQGAGLHVEPELAEALVSDVEHEPGGLPLLSTALLELWQQRDGRHLRHAAYEQSGGVRGAVARLAEDAFSHIDEAQQDLARLVLLRLTEVDEERGVERRRLRRDELEADDSPDVAPVIDVLADRRLLTISDGAVEMAHEALLREWPRLRRWIDEDRDDLRAERSLRVAAREWVRTGWDDGALYRGARLAEAREWAERARPGPVEPAREFLAASLERERRDRRARRRRLALAFGALAVGIVVITAVAIVALEQRRDAERTRDVAVSRELALQSGKMLGVDPALGVRLALWALDTSPTDQAAQALREATATFHESAVLQADSLDANAVDYSPDGTRVVTGGTDGVAHVWDARTHRALGRLAAGHGAVTSARYAPDGDRIALGFADGTVLATDSALAAPRAMLRANGTKVHAVAFGDERIAAALDDGTVRVLGEPDQRLSGHEGPVLSVDISADGSRVVTAGEDGSVRLWQGETGHVLHRGGQRATDVAFSPDGSRILGVGEDGRVRLWSARSGEEEMSVSGEGRGLLAGAFSADGRRFAAGGKDGVTRVWSVAGGPPVAVLRGQRARVYDLAFGATGDRVVSAGDDGTAWIWDAGRTQAWTVPSLTHDIEFNRDGRLVASASDDGTVRVWDSATGRLRTSLPGPDGITLAKFSPTADSIIVSNSSQARLWPLSSRTATVAVQRPKGRTVEYAEFDGSGNRIVYVDEAGRVAVRELASGRETTLGGTPKTVYGAVFSPDGRYVAAAPDRDVLVWRTDRPQRPEHVLKGHRGPVHAIDLSRDGRIVTAGADRTVRVWDRNGRQRLVLRGHQDELTTAVLTRDDRQVVSSSADGSVRLFDARTGAALAVLQAAEGAFYDLALSPDGKIATLGKGEVVRVFSCDVCGSLERVRALALSRSPRPLTAEERQRFLAAAD